MVWLVAESEKDQAFYLSVVWESMMRFLHIGLGGEDEEDFGTPKLLDIWKNPDRFGSQKFNCRMFLITQNMVLWYAPLICPMLFFTTGFKKKFIFFKNFEVGAHFALLTIKVNGPMGQKYNMYA